MYKIDSSAASVVLYEKGETWFGYDENMGFFYQTDVHVRRKILKPAAFDKGTLKLNYYQGTGNSSQRYSKIEGTTYWLENGGIQKNDLSKSDICDE
jgi:TPR repeat protein